MLLIDGQFGAATRFAVVDVYRVEGDMIVEHWDVKQEFPPDSGGAPLLQLMSFRPTAPTSMTGRPALPAQLSAPTCRPWPSGRSVSASRPALFPTGSSIFVGDVPVFETMISVSLPRRPDSMPSPRTRGQHSAG